MMATISNGTRIGTVHVPGYGDFPVVIRSQFSTDKALYLNIGVDIPTPPTGGGEPLPVEDAA